jgi:hypothetical protein
MKLQQAIKAGKVNLRKAISGEVLIRFSKYFAIEKGQRVLKTPNGIPVPHSNAFNLMTVDGVTQESIEHSNLDSLIMTGHLTLL